MKNILIIIKLVIIVGCSSTHKVKVLSVESWDEVDLCVFYVKKIDIDENIVYKIASSKYDTLSTPLKKVSKGDISKLKLLRRPKLKMSKYKIYEDIYYVDESNDSLLIDENYYAPDIEGMYYIKIR